MILKLENPLLVKVKDSPIGQKNKSVEIDSINVIGITDNCINGVFALVKLNDFTSERINLWIGAEYEKIGNWTQEQANECIINHFKNKNI